MLHIERFVSVALFGLVATLACGEPFEAFDDDVDSNETGSGGATSNAASTAQGSGGQAAPSCGDGRLDQATEQCDDGNTVHADGCDATCMPEVQVLLIPHTLVGDKRVAMFAASDGAYLAEFVPQAIANDVLSFPFNAVQAGNGSIYVADSGTKSVHRFDRSGMPDGTFAEMSDVLGDAHGIAFFEGRVYVASGGATKVIAVFDENGQRLPDYVSSGINPYDLLFLPDGRLAVSDIDGDAVKLFSPGGGSHIGLTTTTFPEQLAAVDGETLLVAEFIDDTVFELTTAGVRGRSIAAPSPRGVALLDDGHWLVTSDDGVLTVDPNVGVVSVQFQGDGGWRFIERVWLPQTMLP